jgi:PPIC-type PPIASE domain
MRTRTLLILAVSLAACGREAPPALTVGPVSFTEDQLLGLSDARRAMLADLAAFGLAVADSSAAELGAPFVREQTDDRLLEILAAELTLEKHGVGTADLEAIYRARPDWELTVQQILVYSEPWQDADQRHAAEAKAEHALSLLKSGEDFPKVEADLAAEGGPEARQGVLPPGRQGSWVPEFWAAALALQPGQLSPVTQTQYGFHVIKLLDRKIVPFVEARSQVARRVAKTLDAPEAVLHDWETSKGSDADARRAAALDEAHRRGLEVPEAERNEIQRSWDDEAADWTLQLGFAYGATPDQVGRAALAALGRSGQDAEIARRELSGHDDVLSARYPVVLGTPRNGEP